MAARTTVESLEMSVEKHESKARVERPSQFERIGAAVQGK